MPGDKKGKNPYLKDWGKRASSDEATIRSWWDKWPDAVPAIPTGIRNGIAVVDLDIRQATVSESAKDGVASFRALVLDPATSADVVIQTPSGGSHLVFEYAGQRNTKTDHFGRGIDTRGEGGYIIAPGAVRGGGTYEVIRGRMDDIPLIGLSSWPKALTVIRDEPPEGETQDAAPVDLKTIKDALWCIPPDGSYDDWLAILLALHHATGGNAKGLAYAQA